MDSYTFIKGIEGYIDVARTYHELEKALYGHVIDEGIMCDKLYTIEESLMAGYLQEYYHSTYVFEACCDYIDKCIDDKNHFDIETFNAIVTEALEAESQDALQE